MSGEGDGSLPDTHSVRGRDAGSTERTQRTPPSIEGGSEPQYSPSPNFVRNDVSGWLADRDSRDVYAADALSHLHSTRVPLRDGEREHSASASQESGISLPDSISTINRAPASHPEEIESTTERVSNICQNSLTDPGTNVEVAATATLGETVSLQVLEGSQRNLSSTQVVMQSEPMAEERRTPTYNTHDPVLFDTWLWDPTSSPWDN